MVSEKLGAAFVEVGADLGPLEKSLGSIPGMMHNAGTNITGGLKASLTGGNFSDVGKQLGNQLVTGMSSQFGMLGQAAGTFATALGPAGIALLGIGASIAVIGVGLGKCVSSAATWQTLMVDVQKVTDTTAAGFASLSKDLLAIRSETGASMESIAGAAAGAGRMGIDPTEIAGYTETILKMSSAWGMSADAASESIGKIGSVVKPAEMTWTEFGNRMGSTINDLADSMATSEESIVTGMKKVSAQMAMLKPSPDQLSAWAALIGQLQAFGMTAETSGESLKDALNYMMRDDKSGISSMLDMDATEFQEAIREDAIGTVQELAVAISELPIEEQGQALQKFGATGGQMMGMLVGKVDPVTKEIEGLNAALATGASAWENASSLNEAYAKSQETLHAQIDIFRGKLSVAATSIGGVLLPVFTEWMKSINETTDSLMDLGELGWGAITGIKPDWSDWIFTEDNVLEGLSAVDTKIGEVLSGGTETRGLVGSFVGDVTGALSDGLKSAGGQIKIGDEWVKDMADVQAARDAGKLTAQEYLSGLKEVSSAGMKGPTTGLMDSLQEFATTGKLTTDQYKKSLSSVSEIYSQVGDAAADMTGPLTEGFENGTVSAEDYISILEDMTTVSEKLGDGADEALEPLTQAFEDGTVSAEEYKDIMDDVANAVTSLGSDFDSIAGPIQDAFSQGEISATQYQDAINSISDVHARLGESTEYVTGPITEMFESGEISADEYITALDGVLAGSKEFGTEFTRQMADLNANAGNMSADEYLAAFNDIISDLGVNIEKELKDVDSEGAGSAAASGYINAWNDKMKRWADYHEKTVQRFSRTGTVSVGSDTIEIIYTPDDQLEWAVRINGKSLTGLAYDSPQAAMNAIRKHLPGLWALIDPVEREAALLDALGKYGEAAEMRAQAELKIDWTVDPAIAELEKITEEALNQTFGLKIDLKTALESGLLDFSTAMEDIASDARAVFDDRFVEASEVNDIASRLREARWSDPEKFAEMGGDAALAFFGPLETALNDLEWTLQDIAVYEAQGLVVPIELRDRRDDLIARLKDTLTSEEFEIFIKGNVVIDRSAFGGVKAESLVTPLSVGDLMGKVLGGEQLSAYIGRPDVWKEEVLLPARFEELKQWKEYYDTGWLKPEANVAFANSILELRDAQACLFLTIEDAPIQEYKAISEEHRTGADAVKMLSEIYKGLDSAMNKNKDTTKDYGDELDKLTHELSTACECASDWAKWQEDPANNMFAKSVVTNTQSYVDRIKELAAEGLATETQIRYAAEQALEQNRIDELAEDLLGVGRTTIQTFLECDTSAAEESIESMSTMAEETRTMPLNVDSTGPLEAIRVIDAAAAQPITKLIYLQCLGCVGALGGGQMGGSITFTSGGGLGAVENQYPGITESPGWGTPSWLPVLDSGGLVSGPTLAMLAANAKPEVVAPLDSLFTIIREAVGNKSGGNTFNIVVHEAINAEETAEIVAKKIAESEERIAVAYRNRTKGATYRSSQTTYFGTAGL